MEQTTVAAPRRPYWLRRIALLMAALVASVGTVTVAAPSPASAATSITYCFPIYKKLPGGGWYIDWVCVEIPYAYDPDPCCIYEYAIDLGINPVLTEDIERDYLDRVGNGLTLLAQAALADPRTAVVLRSRAQEAFLGAARQLGQARVDLQQVGIADMENRRLEPAPLPWLESAGGRIADGLSLMQRALAGPSPDPWIQAGMTAFEAAASQLAAPRG
jgi:hypothetical protein